MVCVCLCGKRPHAVLCCVLKTYEEERVLLQSTRTVVTKGPQSALNRLLGGDTFHIFVVAEVVYEERWRRRVHSPTALGTTVIPQIK